MLEITLHFVVSGDADVMLVRYDTNGNVLWAKGIGGNRTDNIGEIIATSDGGCLIGVNFNSTRITLEDGVELKIKNLFTKERIMRNFGNARYANNLFDKLVLTSVHHWRRKQRYIFLCLQLNLQSAHLHYLVAPQPRKHDGRND